MYSNKDLVFKFPYTWRRIRGIWGNIKYIPRMFKWAFQRMVRGYCDGDVWEFDTYLANVIVGGLRQLSKTTHTYSDNFSSAEEWCSFLDSVANDIEEAMSENPGDFFENNLAYSKEVARKQLLLANAFAELGRYFRDLWD